MGKIDRQIQKIIDKHVVDVWGIGDIEKYSKEIEDFGFQNLKEFTRCISIGIKVLKPLTKELSENSTYPTIELYRHFCYNVMNQITDEILFEISRLLIDTGYNTLPIPASAVKNQEKLSGVFSHKAAANIAGLGWIGKNNLLINSKFGPLLRWGTILTNAPLITTGKPVRERCGSCNKCVEICPSKAFTGMKLHFLDSREKRYNAYACNDYLSRMQQEKGERVCGLCIGVCPWCK